MKRIIAILAALLMAAPVMAAVNITAAQVGDTNEVEITYTSTEAQPVRSFALDITVDSGAVITGVDKYFTGGECTSADKGYGIFMSTITISASGAVTSYGSPVSPQAILPADTLGGIGTAGVTVEMASLYDVAVTPSLAPGQTGKLCSVYVDKSCQLCVKANVSRGGIVMEDGKSSEDDPGVPTNLQVCVDVEMGGICAFDMDENGVVNITDYTDMLQKISMAKRLVGDYVITKDDPTTGYLYRECHDPDGDGIVDINNYTTLLRRISMAKRLYADYTYQCGDATIEAIW